GPSAGTVLHAAASSGASATRLRIDRFLLHDATHFQLSILDRKSQPTLDEIECVAAEFLEPPATQYVQILAHAGRKSLQVVRSRDQPRSDTGFFRPDLEEELEEVADQSSVLGQARPTRLAIGKLVRLEGSCRFDGGHQASTD